MVRGPQSTVEREQVLACVAGLLLFAQFPAPEIERAADAGERANHSLFTSFPVSSTCAPYF